MPWVVSKEQPYERWFRDLEPSNLHFAQCFDDHYPESVDSVDVSLVADRHFATQLPVCLLPSY